MMFKEKKTEVRYMTFILLCLTFVIFSLVSCNNSYENRCEEYAKELNIDEYKIDDNCIYIYVLLSEDLTNIKAEKKYDENKILNNYFKTLEYKEVSLSFNKKKELFQKYGDTIKRTLYSTYTRMTITMIEEENLLLLHETYDAHLDIFEAYKTIELSDSDFVELLKYVEIVCNS